MIKKALALVFLALGICSAQTAVFPNGVATTPQLMQAGNNLATKLTAPVTSSATTVFVLNTTGFTANMLITFADTSEVAVICQVNSFQQLTIGYNGTCPSTTGRGFDGTTAAAHINEAQVFGYYTAWHHNVENKEITAIETAIPNTLSDIAYASLSAACSAAGGRTLNISKRWTAVPTQTCAAPLSFVAGGLIEPASGQTVTFTVPAGTQPKLCDRSAGGECYITSSDGKINVNWWGASPALSGGADSTSAFQGALNTCSNTINNCHIIIPTTQTQTTGPQQICYNISSTVLFNSQSSGHSIVLDGGVSALGTCVRWNGSTGGTIMRLNGINGSVVQYVDFLCAGTNIASTGLEIDSLTDSDPAQSNAAGNVIQHNTFGGCSTSGLAIGHATGSTPDISDYRISDNFFAGDATGINFLCSGNCKNLQSYHNEFISCGNPMVLGGSGYNVVHSSFDEFLGNTGPDYTLNAGYLWADTFQDEGGFRLAVLGTSEVQTSAHFSNGYFNSGAAASDGYVIICKCALVVEGNFLQMGLGLTPTKIEMVTSQLASTNHVSASLISYGNTYLGTDATTDANCPFWISAGPQSYYSLINSNWGINDVAFVSIGDRGGPDPFTGIPLLQYSSGTQVMGPLFGVTVPNTRALQAGLTAIDYTAGTTSGFPRLVVSTGVNQWGFINMQTLGQAGTRAQVIAITCDGPHSGEREYVYDLTSPPTYLQDLSTLTGAGGPNPSYWFTCDGVGHWLAQ